MLFPLTLTSNLRSLYLIDAVKNSLILSGTQVSRNRPSVDALYSKQYHTGLTLNDHRSRLDLVGQVARWAGVG